jgi:hypothetical protein
MILILICFTVFTATANDGEKLLKEVNKELRQAQRDMFSGKTEKATAALENIKAKLLKVKADDPNNPRLKTAENKFRKLVKDLERRTGKDLGGGTLTAAGESSTTKMAPKPVAKDISKDKKQPASKEPKQVSKSGTAQMPYAARKPLANANRNLASLERDLNKLADPAYGGNKDQLVGNIEKKVILIKKSLNEAKALAAEKGVALHPDFDSVESKLAEAEKNIAVSKSGYEKEKTAAIASAKEVDDDVAALKSLYDKVQPVFDKATGYIFHYNDLKTVEDVIVEIENFEKNDLGTVETKMQAFASKYGATKTEIDNKADAMGYTGTYYRASYPYMELKKGIENVAKTRDVMAEDLVRRTKAELDGISKGHDFHVLERYEKVKNWLIMAQRYQSDNPKVMELHSSIDKKIADGMKEFNTRVDGRTWPSHVSNAPSNANRLAEAALNWFKNSPDWGKRSSKVRHPLAVTVTGPWSVQKRNLLGEPIMYGLPIKLAVEVNEDKELNVARVYILTMRTAEMRGVKMEPPFDHITVGNSYFIRPDKVK